MEREVEVPNYAKFLSYPSGLNKNLTNAAVHQSTTYRRLWKYDNDCTSEGRKMFSEVPSSSVSSSSGVPVASQDRSTGSCHRHVHGFGSFPPRDIYMRRCDWSIGNSSWEGVDHFWSHVTPKFTCYVGLRRGDALALA